MNHIQTTSDDLTSLRELNAEMFMNISLPPSVDNYVLTDTLDDIYRNNIDETFQLNVDKLIIGFNNMDSGLSFPFYEYMVPILKRPTNGNILKQYLSAYIDNSSQVELLQTKYYPIDDFVEYSYKNITAPSYELLWASMNADVCMICPAMLQTELLVENNIDVEIYMYNFLGASYPYYIPHGAELAFLFNDSDQATEFWGVNWSYNLSYFLTETWKNYAIYGKPNSTVFSDEWIPYSNNGIAMSIQDDNGVIIPNYYNENHRDGVCSFWINDVGINVVQTLCAQSIAVPLEEESDNELEAWVIALMVVAGLFIVIIMIVLVCKCCLNKNKHADELYSVVGDNEMPKYGAP